MHARTEGAVKILWGLLVASVLIPAILLALAAWQSRNQALADAEASSARMVETLKAQVEAIFQTFTLAMDRVDDQVEGRADEDIRTSADLHQRLRALAGSYAQIGSIWVVDQNGAPLNSSLQFPTSGLPLDTADVIEAFNNGARGVHISRSWRAHPSGRAIINVSRPLLGSSGEFRGAIVVTSYPEFFRERFAKAAPDLAYSAGIVRDDGIFIVRDAHVAQPAEEQRASVMFMDAAARSSSGIFVGTSTVDGVQRLMSYRKLDAYPIFIMFGLGTKAILAQWWDQMMLFAAFALAAMLGLGSTTYLALTRTRGAQRAVQNLVEETQRRKQTEAKLVTAQRMEALGQLTGGIAHDFNNLLTVVMGNLDLLRRAKEDRRPRLIDNGMHAVEQGRRLTQQLLAFGRRQNLRPEVLDVNMLIAGMSDMIIQSLRGDIKFELDLADRIWPVEVDPVQLQTALINLAVNARDAMPRGGSFVVRTVNSALGDGPGIAIAVSDTGSGMKPEVLERAFEPFFTTKEIGRGTGLGLSQVTGFIHQSGGAVDITSEVGRGTTVSLLLPRAAADAAAAEAPQSQAQTVVEQRAARILLVEDNAQVRELAASVLAEEGHEVVEAAQADQALQLLQADTTIELVFSDLVMPGPINGLDLARAIRQQRPGLPVVLATGYSEAAAKVLADGFVLVPKPYRPDILAEAVRKALSEGKAAAQGNVVPMVAPSAERR